MLRQAGLALLLTILTLPALAGECPPLPGPPNKTEQQAVFKDTWQWVAEPYSVYDLAGSRDRAPLGVGHLKVEYSSHGIYDWPRKIVLPVWREPGGELLAWVRGGLVIPADGSPPYPLNGAGMVETDYEQLTFIVGEERDGWLQLRLKKGADGFGWAHTCHLELGEIALSYQSWQQLLREKGEWLHFRAEVPHALREMPTTQSRRLTWIGLDHKLKLLQIEGDWMRVEVTQPDGTCTGPDQPFEGTTHEGWVKWRDDTVGPWVWYYTRGC